MAAAKPAVPRVISFKHLDVVRNGNDDYSVTELSLEGDGKTFRTVATKSLCASKSRNVALDYVREWWAAHVGTNGTGGML